MKMKHATKISLFILSNYILKHLFSVDSLQIPNTFTHSPRRTEVATTLFKSNHCDDNGRRILPLYFKKNVTGNRDGNRRRIARSVRSFLPSLPFDKTDTVTSTNTVSTKPSQFKILEQENENLRKTIEELEREKQALECQRRIVIEKFEGEGIKVGSWWDENVSANTIGVQEEVGLEKSNVTVELVSTEDYEIDGACPIEPDVSFQDAFRDRAYWLVGLLALQSMSGFILAKNEVLLQTHPVIVYFLTMLVGAGGNAGNQASVRVIRGIALGTLNDDTQRQFLNREFKMAFSLSCILSLAGFVRAAAFRTPFAETLAITTALALIVFSSICLGSILPLVLRRLKIDPAHSSTTIQVIMDILGVVMTVLVSTAVLDSPLGQAFVTKLWSR